jgi:hypothetical protein
MYRYGISAAVALVAVSGAMLIGQIPKATILAPVPMAAPAPPKAYPPEQPESVPAAPGRPLVPWDLSVEVNGHHVHGFYDPQARTSFTVLPWGVLAAAPDGKADVTVSAADPRTVSCRFLAYPDGFQRLVAAHLRVLLKDQGASYVAKYFVGESLTDAHVVQMALSTLRVEFVQGTLPAASWQIANEDQAEIMLGRDFTARLRFSSAEEAMRARAAVLDKTADLNLTLGFNGIAPRTRTVALQTDFIKDGDFTLDSGPGRGMDAKDQFYSISDVGRIFNRFRERYHVEVLGYTSPPAFAQDLIERFRDHVFRAVTIDLDQAEEKLKGYEGSFVGKQAFRPDLIRKEAQKTVEEFGESVNNVRDTLDKGKEQKQNTESTKDAALNKLKDAYKKAVARTGGLGASVLGYAGNLNVGFTDADEKDLAAEVSRVVDSYQSTSDVHEFERSLRQLLAQILNKKSATEFTVEGEKLVPKRVNLYRVNREALDRRTAFALDQVSLAEARRTVKIVVSPEPVAGDVVRKVPVPATTVDHLDLALRPMKDELKGAVEKAGAVEARAAKAEQETAAHLERIEAQFAQRLQSLETRLAQFKVLTAEGAFLRTVDITFNCRPGEKVPPVFVPFTLETLPGGSRPEFLGGDIEYLANGSGEVIQEQKVIATRKDGRDGIFVSTNPTRVKVKDSKITVKLFVFSKGGPLKLGVPEPWN